MDRRKWLLTVGTIVSATISGCLESEDNGGTDDEPTEEETTEEETTDEEKSPAEFVMTESSLSESEIETGQSVDIEGKVENIGGKSGTVEVDLHINQERVDSKEVDIPPGDTSTIVFFRDFDQAGNYEIQLMEEEVGELSVRAQEVLNPNPSAEYEDNYLQLTHNRLQEKNIDYQALDRGENIPLDIDPSVIVIELDVDELGDSEPIYNTVIGEIHRELVRNGESGGGIAVISFTDGCFETYAIEHQWAEEVNSGEMSEEEYYNRISETHSVDC